MTAVTTTDRPETSSETAVATISARPHEVIAINQPQLEQAHEKMLEWVGKARAQTFAELDEERSALATATERKWATDPFKRRIARLAKRVEFFDKIEEGLRAGLVLVPNFPMDIFAIRTAAKMRRGAK